MCGGEGRGGGGGKEGEEESFAIFPNIFSMTKRKQSCELSMPGLVSCARSGSAVLKSGWEKKACSNAVMQDRKILGLGSIPGSCRKSSFWARDPCGHWDEIDTQQESIYGRIVSRKHNSRGWQKMRMMLGGRDLLVFG